MKKPCCNHKPVEPTFDRTVCAKCLKIIEQQPVRAGRTRWVAIPSPAVDEVIDLFRGGKRAPAPLRHRRSGVHKL